jgi:hypothetical protein
MINARCVTWSPPDRTTVAGIDANLTPGICQVASARLATIASMRPIALADNFDAGDP